MGLRDFINYASKQYGVDPGIVDNIARLESGYRADALNDWDVNAKNGTPSFGAFQYIAPTFHSFAPKARAANPNAWKHFDQLNWKDPRQQALTTAWAIKNNLGSHWATYDRARQAAGDYNYQPRFRLAPGGTLTPGSSLGGAPAGQKIPLKKYKPIQLTHDQKLLLSQPEGKLSDYLDQDWKSRALESQTNPNMEMVAQIDANRRAEVDEHNRYARQQNAAIAQAAANTGDPAVAGTAAGAMGWNGQGNPFRFLEKKFGLARSSTDHDAPGVHTTGSFHYRPAPWGGVQGYDYGDAKNDPRVLRALGQWLRQNNNYQRVGINEFFYDPLGWYIDNGRLVKGSIGGHGDHAHISIAGGQ